MPTLTEATATMNGNNHGHDEGSQKYDKVSMFDRQFKLRTQLFINNEFVDSKAGKTFEVVCPANGKVITHVSEAESDDVDVAVKAARAALSGPWKTISPCERGRLLYKLADLLEERSAQFVDVEVLDNGKPISEASAADIPMSIKCLRYYAGWSDKVHGTTIPTGDGWFVYTTREPVGVVAQIIPWNFPLLMAVWKLGPALCTGNTVILKPAEQTPLTALLLGDLVREVGFPPGVLNILPGFGPVCGAALASHMDVDKVAFTGSVSVGRKIQVMAANSNLKNVSLELGGKSPNIILGDADLVAALEWSQKSIFFNQGEVCTAGSRMFVQNEIYDKFVGEMADRANKVNVGNPFDPHTTMGAQVSEVQFKKILGYIEEGKREGAKLIAGGAAACEEGFFLQPTVFKDVEVGHTIFKEEIFGPVLAITPFATIDEVIEKANLTTYGLAASVFTSDINKAHKIAASVRAGTVWVNGYHNYHAAAPFGGMKQSGLGREKGEEVLNAYTETKTTMIRLE